MAIAALAGTTWLWPAAADGSLFVLGSSSRIWRAEPVSMCERGKYNPPAIIAPEVAKNGELEALLDCLWDKESSRGKNMIGDGGLAIGHYQIHIDKHPVTYDCAMDFNCSRNYTRQMILSGKGYLWTGYKKCL